MLILPNWVGYLLIGSLIAPLLSATALAILAFIKLGRLNREENE